MSMENCKECCKPVDTDYEEVLTGDHVNSYQVGESSFEQYVYIGTSFYCLDCVTVKYKEPKLDFSPVAHLDLTNVEITEECKREVEAAR